MTIKNLQYLHIIYNIYSIKYIYMYTYTYSSFVDIN